MSAGTAAFLSICNPFFVKSVAVREALCTAIDVHLFLANWSELLLTGHTSDTSKTRADRTTCKNHERYIRLSCAGWSDRTKRIQQRTVGILDLLVPQSQEQTVGAAKVFPHELVVERMVERTVYIPIDRHMEEIVRTAQIIL